MGLFRLFRLLQLLRTFSKIEQLRIIIESLQRSIGPMKFVFALFLVFNYLAAIAGMALFSENDPFHFGSLGGALMTIYRVETLQNWEVLMFLEMLGCDTYRHGSYGRAPQGATLRQFSAVYTFHAQRALVDETRQSPPQANTPTFDCETSQALGWLAAAFFIFVTIIGGLLLPTLLVALITACTDEASRTVARELETIKAVRAEIFRHPDFYSSQRLRLVSDLFEVGYRQRGVPFACAPCHQHALYATPNTPSPLTPPPPLRPPRPPPPPTTK